MFSGNSESKETETRKQLQGPKMIPLIGRKKRRKKAGGGRGAGWEERGTEEAEKGMQGKNNKHHISKSHEFIIGGQRERL